ncbi:FabD/lysophospholipase-like protein, partial [Microthyrium microscopicum]
PTFRPPSRISVPASTVSSNGDYHTGKSWARTVHTEDAWQPLILTCDGGGIRGYSTLLILKAIMHEVAVWENNLEAQEKPVGQRRTFNEDELLPCHYFDFMYGTSTGGLIATMLGRLRMGVPAAIEIYKQVGQELFGRRRSKMPLGTKYAHEPLEEAVKRIVQTHCPISHDPSVADDGCDWNPWACDLTNDPNATDEPFWRESTNRICQSICLTAIHDQNINRAYLLRTYNHTYNNLAPKWVSQYNEGAEKLRIWQVTRATSAAPFYFQSLVADIGGETKEFKDGGIRENNPSVAAWSEFISIYGERTEPAALISIGTGRPNMTKDGFPETWPGPFGQLSIVKKFAETFAVLKNMLVKYTEGERQHEEMVHQAQGQYTWYKRLNVNTGLQDLRLDNWEPSSHVDEAGAKVTVPGGTTLQTIEEATNAYLNRTDIQPEELKEYTTPKVMVQQIAEKMVRHRRMREHTARDDPEHSERWASYMGRRL